MTLAMPYDRLPRRTLPIGLGMVLLAMTAQGWAFDFSDLDAAKVVSGGTKLAQALGGISDEDEIKIGREVAANLAARYGLVEDAAKARYLNLVGKAVARHSDRTKIPYHFAILRTSEINALAAPGGYIFITQGLLDTLKDESELAGVLAHEVTHVVRRHIVKAIRQANLVEAGGDLASATGKDVGKFSQLNDFSINLLSKGLSRSDELEADKGGTILAARAGYDPQGLRRSIERLAVNGKPNILLDHFNKTHPNAPERLRAIDQTIRQQGLSKPGERLVGRFKKGFPS
jgi:beta-barrel assembly-enhancing protease